MDINKITLQYLMNPDLYDKMIETPSLNNNYIEFANDKEFYKKRIINLTKKMFNNNFETPQLQLLFEMYVKNLIIYFKEIDTKDIIQKDYKNLNLYDTSRNKIFLPEDLDKANTLIYREKSKINLEKYVNYNKSTPIISVIPTKKNINLKDPQLKKKD